MASKKTFGFKLEQNVSLESGETGKVIGRAHYLNADPNYLVRYVNGTGSTVEEWWTEDALIGKEGSASGDGHLDI